MSISLTAEQKSIQSVFTTNEKFVIPLYQRPYSWGYDECNQLYNDLIESFENNEPYFLGNIIIAKSLDIKTKKELEVIDGQQRLTTLLLLFKALRLLYPKKYKSLDNSIWLEDEESEEKYPKIISKIFEVVDENKNLSSVINYTEEDFKNLYKECINNDELNYRLITKKYRNNRFLQNLMFFYHSLDFYFKDNCERMREYIIYLMENVYLLPIELIEENKEKARNKALLIFERINNRGLDLRDADIFKSYLYSKAKNKEQFAKYWYDIKNRVENLGYSIDDVFRFYSHIIRGERGIITSEISLKEFFTLKKYSPFKMKLYDEIINDLFKIVEILEVLNEMKETNKWLQILSFYTNQFPTFAVVSYLYKNYFDVFNKQNFENFLIKIVRYVYKIGATSYVKFEIYKIISYVFSEREIPDYFDRNYREDDFYMGRLKKGYYLLAYYLGNDIIENLKVDRIYTYKEIEKIGLENYYDSIANFCLKNEKKKLKGNVDLKNREEYLKNIIVDFFRGNNVRKN